MDFSATLQTELQFSDDWSAVGHGVEWKEVRKWENV